MCRVLSYVNNKWELFFPTVKFYQISWEKYQYMLTAVYQEWYCRV
jgi:hypothetical protein